MGVSADIERAGTPGQTKIRPKLRKVTVKRLPTSHKATTKLNIIKSNQTCMWSIISKKTKKLKIFFRERNLTCKLETEDE